MHPSTNGQRTEAHRPRSNCANLCKFLGARGGGGKKTPLPHLIYAFARTQNSVLKDSSHPRPTPPWGCDGARGCVLKRVCFMAGTHAVSGQSCPCQSPPESHHRCIPAGVGSLVFILNWGFGLARVGISPPQPCPARWWRYSRGRESYPLRNRVRSLVVPACSGTGQASSGERGGREGLC